MKTLKLITVLYISALLVACGSSDGGKRVKYGDSGQLPAGSGKYFESCDENNFYSGSLYVEHHENEAFQLTVDAFLSAIGDPGSFLGHIKGSCGNNTGVMFSGRVQLNNGFNRNGNNSGQISSNSSVKLAFIDDYAVYQGDPPISIVAENGAYGSVYGQSATVEVEWELGSITFNGNINYQTQTFSGVVTFENFENYDGGNPAEGTLGKFSVPLCDFFVCN